MSDKKIEKDIFIVNIFDDGDGFKHGILVEKEDQDDEEDAIAKVRNAGFFDGHEINRIIIETTKVLFKSDFFGPQRNELYFPTLDDPFGQINIIEKYRKAEYILAFFMQLLSLMTEELPIDRVFQDGFSPIWPFKVEAKGDLLKYRLDKIFNEINKTREEKLKCQTKK